MKKYIYILMLSLFASQLKAQTVNYSYVIDNPYDYKNLSFAIDPFFMDANTLNGFAGGWGVRADFLMGKRLQINFDMRNAFGTRGYDIKDDNTRNYFFYEGSLGLVLSEKQKKGSYKIILSQSSYSSGGYTYTSTKYISGVEGKFRRIIMLRGGAYQMGNSVYFKTLSDSLTTFTPRDGGAELTYKQFKEAHYPNTDDVVGGFASTAVFGGFSFKKIINMVIDVEGYGLRGVVRYSDFYIDGIFSPVVSLKNFTTADGKEFDVKNSQKKLFGWRMGWTNRHPKMQSFSTKFEIGQRPGYGIAEKPQFGGAYAMFTFGLDVPFKVRPIHTGDE